MYFYDRVTQSEAYVNFKINNTMYLFIFTSLRYALMIRYLVAKSSHLSYSVHQVNVCRVDLFSYLYIYKFSH